MKIRIWEILTLAIPILLLAHIAYAASEPSWSNNQSSTPTMYDPSINSVFNIMWTSTNTANINDFISTSGWGSGSGNNHDNDLATYAAVENGGENCYYTGGKSPGWVKCAKTVWDNTGNNTGTRNLTVSFNVSILNEPGHWSIKCETGPNTTANIDSGTVNLAATNRTYNISVIAPSCLAGRNNLTIFYNGASSMMGDSTDLGIIEEWIDPPHPTNTVFIDGNWSGEARNYTMNSSYSNAFCYQETANVSTACGGLNTGNYVRTLNGNGGMYDGDWNTIESWTGLGVNYTGWYWVNYTKPDFAEQSSMIQYRVQTDNSGNIPIQNKTIPSDCWSQSLLQFRLEQFNGEWGNRWSELTCYNGTSWVNISARSPNGGGAFYEEAMWWNISSESEFTYSDVLPAGTFYWKSYAHDGNGTWAASDTWTVTIPKADNDLKIMVNGTEGNATIAYGEAAEVSAEGVDVKLYRDDVEVSNPDILLGPGAYVYTANSTGNQNYTENTTSITVNIMEPPHDEPSPQPSGGGGGGTGGAIMQPGFTPIANDTGDAPIAAPVNATNITKVNVTQNITNNKPKEPEFDGGPIGIAASALLMATAALPDFKIRRLLKRSKKPKKEQLQEPKEEPKAIDLAAIIAETRRTYMLFPTGKAERIAVEMNIARRIQAEQGNFYSAQVIGVLMTAYPNDAPKMEMEIAGEMWEWMNNGGAVPDKRIGGIPFYKLAE